MPKTKKKPNLKPTKLKPKLKPTILPSSRQLTKLSRPTSFYFNRFRTLHDLHILILGEYHDTNLICEAIDNGIEIHDWLTHLSKDAPVPLDLFVEDFYGDFNDDLPNDIFI